MVHSITRITPFLLKVLILLALILPLENILPPQHRHWHANLPADAAGKTLGAFVERICPTDDVPAPIGWCCGTGDGND